ncbi:unnamed protein product [Rotaria sp. Silwood1]|nr:unnamed protein product [Rotaria sp. Silwood1]
MYQFLWHIHIDGDRMSLLTFNDFCENILKVVRHRVVSLRITFKHVVGGWSLVSSALKYHQTMLLRHVQLIDIQPYEFDKFLCNHLTKQLHTLIVDVTEHNPFNYQAMEGAYLAKVCSCLPALTICRLPFNFCRISRKKLLKSSTTPLMSLPNVFNTTYLHTLTVGVNTSRFLEHLLPCIPFIQNLSIGIADPVVIKDDGFDIVSMPVAVDAHLLRNLVRVRVNCLNTMSFHRTIVLLSCVLDQLIHFSLKLNSYASACDPFAISGDIIQQTCIDRLKPSASYALDLFFNIEKDLKEKEIYNSFVKAAFFRRQKPRVIIQERNNWDIGRDHHCFILYTSPYNGTKLQTHFFSEHLSVSSKSMDPTGLFPRANELLIEGLNGGSSHHELSKSRKPTSSFVPWSLLTKIVIDGSYFISAAELEAILRMSYNVHTLQIKEDNGSLCRAILFDTANLATRINQQIKSFDMDAESITLRNGEYFCKRIFNRLPDLKHFSFSLHNSHDEFGWHSSNTRHGQIACTERIVNHICYLLDHFQQLVSLDMSFVGWTFTATPCFSYLIRRQLHELLLNRPYRVRCSEKISIWL